MAGSVTDEISAAPNLTPLLDVVFQLITFFMLVINFSNENYDQRIRLPVAGSARPVDKEQVARDRLILNIDRDGRLLMGGEVLDPERAAREIHLQADLIRLNAKAAGVQLEPGADLPTTIVLRSDRQTPFAQLFRTITTCQEAKFRKFDLKAMSAGP
ncbi:MAG TPA: biopolymer transporter ExbD [Isosphaeraceae bacterium]